MSIFEFEHLNEYLKYMITRLPNKGRGEVNRIAKYLNVNSTLISQILSGNKTMSLEQALNLTQYLGLLELEADYLITLVEFERAGSSQLQEYWKKKLQQLKNKSFQVGERLKKDRKITDIERAKYYSSPYYPAIRLFTSIGENGQTLQSIAQRFQLSPMKVSEILNFLVQTGLCSEQNGYFRMEQQTIHLEKGSDYHLRYQTDWRIKAISTAEQLSDQELMFTGQVTLSKKDFYKLREETMQFIKKFLDTVHDSPAEELACLNIDWFFIR